MRPLRLLVVDDSPEFIESAVRFLAYFPHLQVVGRALSGQQALEQSLWFEPDVVLMDLAMPGMNGLEATRSLKQGQHPPRVVILTLHDNAEYRAAAFAAHADGFVAKSEFGSQLVPVIESLLMPEPPTG